MPKKSLQENTFPWFNNLIRGDRVEISPTSQSNNYVSFSVKGSYRSTIKGLSIGHYNNDNTLSNIRDNSTIVIATNCGVLGRFKPKDENYELLYNIFNDARNAKRITYTGRQFLDSILPSLGNALSSYQRNQLTTESVQADQQVAKSASTVGTTTTLSTEAIPHDDPNYIFNITIEPSTEPIENNTSTKSFNFEAANQLGKSTTKGIDDTTQAIAISNTTNGITTPNGEIAVSSELLVSNTTSIPTAIPAIEGSVATRMSAAAIVGIVGGVVGILAVGAVGVKKLYDYCYRTDTYNLAKEGQANPHISKTTLPKTVRFADVSNGEAEAQLFLPKGDNGQIKPTTLDDITSTQHSKRSCSIL